MVGNSVDVVSVLDSVGCSVEVSPGWVVSSMKFVVVSISVEVGSSVALAVVVSSSSTFVVDDWSVDASSSSTPTVVESSTCKSAGEGDGAGEGGGEGAPWNCGYVSASSPSCGGFGRSPFTTSRKESDEGESPSD